MSDLRRYPETAKPGSLSSDVTVVGGLAFVTSIPTDSNGQLAGETIEQQSVAVIENMRTDLERCGSNLNRIAHLTIYLTDIENQRAGFNEIYRTYFEETLPVRCAVGVARLARPGMHVELTAVAAV
ncbi:RidA family protein [Arthrobacter sp. NPDC080082]|uniref:RidA family protein n=1 Tax=unclassified Arthrobacter TaxID=235627 RepID=UPI0034158DE3